LKIENWKWLLVWLKLKGKIEMSEKDKIRLTETVHGAG